MCILLMDIRKRKRACAFVRTLGSDERLEEQLERINKYAKDNACMLVDIIKDYSSGSEIDRMKIEELYEGIEKGDYNLIIVTHSDRIANSLNDVEAFCDRIYALGGKVYSLEEGYCIP